MGLKLAVVTLAAAHAAWSLAPALFRIRNDFANYYVPARAVWWGESLDRAYERTWFPRAAARAGLEAPGSFVPHPPANALLLLPVAFLSPLAAKAAWTAFLALCGVLAFMTLRRCLASPSSSLSRSRSSLSQSPSISSNLPSSLSGSLSSLSRSPSSCSGSPSGGSASPSNPPLSSSLQALSPWMLALVLLLPTASWANALLYGQPYPLLLLLLCSSLVAAMRGRDLLAGALLAPIAVLKLYGLPFLAWFVLTRRWRAVAGMTATIALLWVIGLAVLGWPVHEAWLREVLPASLAGQVQDPYSTIWGSFSSLSHRLFAHEPDLNPDPLLDAPALAQVASRALPLMVLVAAVWSAVRAAPAAGGDGSALARAYAALTLASLAASPLTASYHFVLLALPVAVLVSLPETGRWRVALPLGLLAFATSPLPHYFARFAHGGANVLAYPRLVAVLALLVMALPSRLGPAASMGASTLALALALGSGLPGLREEPWTRLPEPRGYLSAEPIACGGRLTWVTIAGEATVRRDPAGILFPEPLSGTRCVQGRLVEAPPASGAIEPADADELTIDGRAVRLHIAASGELLVSDGGGAMRRLDRGKLRHPRLSPDGRWIVYQAWDGSWNLRAAERSTGRVLPLTTNPANELEPSWTEKGDAVLFASDRRRGLGSTAVYSLSFP